MVHEASQSPRSIGICGSVDVRWQKCERRGLAGRVTQVQQQFFGHLLPNLQDRGHSPKGFTRPHNTHLNLVDFFDEDVPDSGRIVAAFAHHRVLSMAVSSIGTKDQNEALSHVVFHTRMDYKDATIAHLLSSSTT